MIVSLHLASKLEDEKALLQAQKREAEQEKLTIRDELVRLEQDRLELDSARITLHQSLQDTELSRVGMEAELQSLRAERLKLQEKVTQVHTDYITSSFKGEVQAKKTLKQQLWAMHLCIYEPVKLLIRSHAL